MQGLLTRLFFNKLSPLVSSFVFLLFFIVVPIAHADFNYTQYPVPTTQSDPHNITTGPDGNMWFVENNTSKIGKITPSGEITEYNLPTDHSAPTNITTGPDGALWFTEAGAGQIARIL